MAKIKFFLRHVFWLIFFYGLGFFWLHTAYDRIGKMFVTKSTRYGTTSPSWEWDWWNGIPHILVGGLFVFIGLYITKSIFEDWKENN